MAKIEVDEEEVRAANQLRAAVNTIWANPKARLLVQQAQKVIDPNAKTPDLDRQTEALAPVEAVQKEFRDYVAKTEADKAEQEKNTKLDRLKGVHAAGIAELRRQKYTDEGIKAVEALMDEKGILDPLDAAAIFEKAHPPQMPVTPGGVGGAWNFAEPPAEGEAFVKKLFETKGANDLVADKEAWAAINEQRGAARH